MIASLVVCNAIFLTAETHQVSGEHSFSFHKDKSIKIELFTLMNIKNNQYISDCSHFNAQTSFNANKENNKGKEFFKHRNPSDSSIHSIEF